MGARQKLNGAAITGAMVFALLVGTATASYPIAIIIFMGAIGAAFASQDIRLGSRRKG
jgi:hypothetical protein